MKKSDPSIYNLTKMAGKLPKEDLALMASLVDELSLWERKVLLPFLGMDIQFLRLWLLAGVDEYGMLESAKHRRRCARRDFFIGSAQGRLCVDNKHPMFARAPLAGLIGAIRQIFFWMHLGPPVGGRNDRQFRKVEGLKAFSLLGGVILLCSFLCMGILFDMNKSSIHMDAPGLLVSLVGPGPVDRSLAVNLLLLAVLRVGVWFWTPEMPSLAAAAQGATPLAWRWAVGLRAYAEQRAEAARFEKASARSLSHEAIGAAIKRASLGQDPTPEEIELDRQAEVEAALRAAALEAASNPDLALANMERKELEASARGGSTGRSKSL